MEAMEFARNLLNNSPYNQEQIAMCLDVDQSLVSKWKNGTRDMTAVQFIDLCSLVGFSMLDYLNGVNSPNIKMAFSSKGLTREDIFAIGKFSRLLANLSYMEVLDSNESKS